MISLEGILMEEPARRSRAELTSLGSALCPDISRSLSDAGSRLRGRLPGQQWSVRLVLASMRVLALAAGSRATAGATSEARRMRLPGLLGQLPACRSRCWNG